MRGAVRLVASVRHRIAGQDWGEEHRGGVGAVAEMAGGGSSKKTILKTFSIFSPCYLSSLFQPVALESLLCSSPHSVALQPHPTHAQRHLPPILSWPSLQAEATACRCLLSVSHFLSVPSVYFPPTARGKSLLRIKSPGSFP